MSRVKFYTPLALALAAGLLLFQNCSGTFFGGTANSDSYQSGNGDGYGGKTTYYAGDEVGMTCSSRDQMGRPLPARMVLLSAAGASLVRRNCEDIDPLPLAPSEVQISVNRQELVYLDQTLTVVPDVTVFNAVPALCPAGRTPSGAWPQIVTAEPLNLTAGPWEPHVGVSSSLYGTLEAMPRYRIGRTGGGPFDFWRRLIQFSQFDAGAPYAFTVLFERGNTSHGYFSYWADVGGVVYDFTYHLDLTTGQVTEEAPPTNLTSVVATSRPYGKGFVLTVFVTLPNAQRGSFGAGTSNGDPSLAAPGDFVFATAVGAQKVDQYCNP